jgi:hypothetical protein
MNTDDQTKARRAMREKNREILAERQGHPPETLTACRDLEAQFPGWSIWYSSDDFIHHTGPHYAAHPEHARLGEPDLCAPDPETLTILIKVDEGQRRTRGTAANRRGPDSPP